MNYEELLHEYFDGELDEQHEESLFAMLSHDAGLRREFSDFMRLRAVASNEALIASPPTELTAAVFGGLGYNLDASQESTAQPGVVPSASRLASILPYVATSILSSLVTALVVVLLLRPDGESGSLHRSGPVVQSGGTVHGERILHSGQSASQQHETSAPSGAPDSQRWKASDFFTSDRSTEIHISDNGAAISTEDKREYLPVTAVAAIAPEQGPAIASRHTDSEVLPDIAISPFFSFDDGSDRFDLFLYSSAMRSFPSVDVPTQVQGITIPLAISALYILSEEHSLGVEFGREAFAQEFAQTIDGERVTVLQNPTLWWGGISYRYMPEQMRWDSFSMFAQGTVGGAEVGPFGRLKLGLDWMPYSHFTLTAGVEGSGLLYSVENALYSTAKLGIVYGVRVQF